QNKQDGFMPLREPLNAGCFFLRDPCSRQNFEIFFGFGGGVAWPLASDMAQCISQSTRRDGAPRCATVTGRPGRAVYGRCEPNQMASRAYDVVFRAISARAQC